MTLAESPNEALEATRQPVCSLGLEARVSSLTRRRVGCRVA